jgi:glyoxylase I family protein
MANSTIAPKGFHHVALRVKNFSASKEFYTQALGFTPVHAWGGGENGNRAVMLDTGAGDYIELFEGGQEISEPVSPLLHFALHTNDCDAAVDRARRAGAKITVETKNVDIPSDPPYPVRIAFCKGPDGEVIEFFQERT